MLRKAALPFVLSLLVCSPVPAQQWAVEMFQTTTHDFGTLARGAKAEFQFVLSNVYVDDVHISSVRSSCGCTDVRLEERLLKTYEKGAIIASLNTSSFLGSKGATITVTFDKPRYAEVQLQVRGYIRSDVVFQPGSVAFGDVNRGTPAEKKIAVNYAGRNDWQILEIRSDNPHLTGNVVQTRRAGGLMSYELLVHLDKDAPVGYINDHLILVTNDRQSTQVPVQVPVQVEGRVLSGVTVSPASLFMGVLQPGQKVKKQLVVRSKKPCRIVSVTCDDTSFEFDTFSEQDAKMLHLIPVTFVAGNEPGKVFRTIHIETDLGDYVPDLPAYAVVALQQQDEGF